MTKTLMLSINQRYTMLGICIIIIIKSYARVSKVKGSMYYMYVYKNKYSKRM